MSFCYFSLSNENYFVIIIVITLLKSVRPQFIRPVEFNIKPNWPGVTTPEDTSTSLIEMKYSYDEIYIDFGRNQSQVIVIRNAVSVIIYILFKIHASSSSMRKTFTNELCFQTKVLGSLLCENITNKKRILDLFHMDVSAKWLRDKSGFRVTIDLPTVVENDFSGFYYLNISSPNFGMILSNYLEIRDVLYWDKNIKVSSLPTIMETYKSNITLFDIPKIFSCSGQLTILNSEKNHFWIPLEYTSLVKWAWCPVSKKMIKTSPSVCLRCTYYRCDDLDHFAPIFPGMMRWWTEIISYSEDSIALTNGGFFKSYDNQLDGYALMCYYHLRNSYKALKYIADSYSEDKTQFMKGLHWDSKIKEHCNITLISSINQTIKFQISKKNFILSAFYHAPSNYTYNWIRLGKNILNVAEWVVKPYSLENKNKITFDMGGMYYLKITSYSKIIEFRFTVVILTPPILVNKSPEPILSTIYLMVKSNFSIKCSYKGNPTFANIYINGLLYEFAKSDLKIFLDNLAKKYANLNHLDFHLVKNELSDEVREYTYTVKNVSFDESLNLGQDHNINFDVGNEYGTSRMVLNIYVLKPPKFESVPKHDNCTTLCSSLKSHLFRCELNIDYFKAREVQVDKIWLVNDMKLDTLPYHKLYFKADEKGLHLNLLSSNSSKSDMAVRVLLKDANLTCRVRLLYPGSLNMLDSQMIREKRIIYDTLHDPVFTNQLSAEIRIK